MHIYGTPAHLEASSLHFYSTPAHLEASSLHFYGASAHLEASSLHFFGAPAYLEAASLHFYGAHAHLDASSLHFYGTLALSGKQPKTAPGGAETKMANLKQILVFKSSFRDSLPKTKNLALQTVALASAWATWEAERSDFCGVPRQGAI